LNLKEQLRLLISTASISSLVSELLFFNLSLT
jgi:hypothetical protein